MLAVEPVAGLESDHELRVVRVRLVLVRHRHLTAMVELDPSVELVLESAPEDRLAARSAARRVAQLHHEVLHHAMDEGVVVVALQRQLDEITAAYSRKSFMMRSKGKEEEEEDEDSPGDGRLSRP